MEYVTALAPNNSYCGGLSSGQAPEPRWEQPLLPLLLGQIGAERSTYLILWTRAGLALCQRQRVNSAGGKLATMAVGGEETSGEQVVGSKTVGRQTAGRN